MIDKPRLGFLGAGSIGRHQLETVANARAAEIAAVADPLADSLEAARLLAPNAVCSSSFDELLDEKLDGIVISTPSALQAEQTIAALNRGLAVFCQKPLARNGDEVATVIDAARRADRLLGVDLSYRHVEAFTTMRSLVLSGALGTVFAADLAFHISGGPGKPWFYDRALSGGGCLIDLGIHLVDVALWIFRGPVTSVSSALYAEGHRLKPGAQAIEDHASVRLELSSGSIVNLACSWKVHAGQGAVIQATFYGTNGGAALRNLNGSFTEFRAERFAGTTRQLLAQPPDPWEGRAILAWIRQLQESARYDPAIETREEVARIIDRIYGEPAQL